jgi:hypothetical protein
MRRLPWVGLPTDSTVLGHHRFAVAGEKYVRALAEAAEVTPVVAEPAATAAGRRLAAGARWPAADRRGQQYRTAALRRRPQLARQSA